MGPRRLTTLIRVLAVGLTVGWFTLRFVLLLGGAWSKDVKTCLSRKNTAIGSSMKFCFSGVLSSKQKSNPDFYNWNRIKVKYCNGESFTGDVEAVHPSILFRCSAGGLASILHCDSFRSLLPRTTKVKCLSDAGYFIHGTCSNGGLSIEAFYSEVVKLHGSAKTLRASYTSRMESELADAPVQKSEVENPKIIEIGGEGTTPVEGGTSKAETAILPEEDASLRDVPRPHTEKTIKRVIEDLDKPSRVSLPEKTNVEDLGVMSEQTTERNMVVREDNTPEVALATTDTEASPFRSVTNNIKKMFLHYSLFKDYVLDAGRQVLKVVPPRFHKSYRISLPGIDIFQSVLRKDREIPSEKTNVEDLGVIYEQTTEVKEWEDQRNVVARQDNAPEVALAVVPSPEDTSSSKMLPPYFRRPFQSVEIDKIGKEVGTNEAIHEVPLPEVSPIVQDVETKVSTEGISNKEIDITTEIILETSTTKPVIKTTASEALLENVEVVDVDLLPVATPQQVLEVQDVPFSSQRVVFQGATVSAGLLPFLERAWEKHGPFAPVSALQSGAVKSFIFDSLGHILKDITTIPLSALSTSRVKRMLETLNDLEYFHCKLDWLAIPMQMLQIQIQARERLQRVEELDDVIKRLERELLIVLQEHEDILNVNKVALTPFGGDLELSKPSCEDLL